jgi:transcriptional regulator with XRE-family HTH domain
VRRDADGTKGGAVEQPTSGTALVDTLIDGVKVGDNLVFQGGAGTPLEVLVERFVASVGDVSLVRVNLAAPWEGPVGDDVIVVDWSPVLTGQTSDLEWSVPPDATFEQALALLQAADEHVGPHAAFVFDPLTAVEAAWGQDAALELFLSTCPRLYRRRSLALWPVHRDQHRPAFLRRLAEITQVVVDLTQEDGQLRVEVHKADGRDAGVVGRSVHAEVVDGDLRATDDPINTRQRLGSAIREQRLARGHSQAEVARRVGITPSALSQVERGVRGPSGDTLVRLWEVLGVPFGPSEERDPGYRLARRSGREHVRLQDGLAGERVLRDEAAGEVWVLQVDPGASGAQGPFAVKAPETVLVLRGVLDLQLGGRTETLHEGDALVATAAPVTGWANPGGLPAEVVWTLHAS